MFEQSSPCQQINIDIHLHDKKLAEDVKSVYLKRTTSQESSDIGSERQAHLRCHMVAKLLPDQKLTKVKSLIMSCTNLYCGGTFIN